MSTPVLALVVVVSVAAAMTAAPQLPGHGMPLARVLARGLVWVLMPAISFFVIAHLKVSSGLGLGLVMAYGELAVVGTLAWLVATRVLHLSRAATGALVVTVILGNTGYLGLPLITSLLGTKALGPAVVWDSIVSGPMFVAVAMTLGAIMGGHPDERTSRRDIVVALLRNPPLIAVIAGLLAGRWAPSLAPDAGLHVAHVLVYVTVPIAFAIVGISLREEDEALRFPPPLTPTIGTALVLRLLVAPLLLLGLSAVLLKVPTAYLLQAGMPCGANGVIVAHVHDLDVRIPAAAIAWSTALVLVAGIVGGAVT